MPAKPPTRNFRPLKSVHGLDLFPEPAAHLGARAAGRKTDALILLQEIVQHIHAAAEPQPGDMRARVETERQRCAEREGGVLAPVVIERGVAHFDGAVRDGVEHLQARHDFAGGERLDLELVVGEIGDALAEIFAAAVERVEGLRPACRHPPLYFRVRLCNRRRGYRSRGQTDAANLQEITTLHFSFPSAFCRCPTKERRSLAVSCFPIVGAGLLFGVWALKPRLLVFECNFPALWTCGQDDELVIDNQGLWLRRKCESCLNSERKSRSTRRKTKIAVRRTGDMASPNAELLQCSISATIPAR